MDRLFTGDRQHPERNTASMNAGYLLYLAQVRARESRHSMSHAAVYLKLQRGL